MDNITIFVVFSSAFELEKEQRRMIKKKEGFEGQKMIVLPHSIVHMLEKDPITAPIHITDIGYYPEARYHFRERKNGCKQYILIFCTEGKGWFKLGDRIYNVSPDNYFILPPDVHHSYGADDNVPWSIFWIHFKGSSAIHFSNKLNVINQIHPVKFGTTDDRIQLFEEIYQTLDNGYSIDNLQYASMCLWHFLSSFFFVNHFKHYLYEKKHDIINQTIDYFKKNISRNLLLKEISGHLGLSASHFSNIFRNKTGYAPIEYFSRLKIQRACQYLDLTDLRVKEISSLLGYDDPYYFSRVFNKIMGDSPRNYKKKKKG
jgi:AraC-like DNA-binding protein